jgi:biopolymer transport protein ExbB/TolQ
MDIFVVFSSKNWLLIAIFCLMFVFSIINWGIIIFKFFELRLLKNLYIFNKNEFEERLAIFSKNKNLEIFELGVDGVLSKYRHRMEKGLGFLASSASMIPFVGLLGTVIGIADALKQISLGGSANIAVIAGPIGEALASTAFGLIVAIPAGFFYNFFSSSIESILLKARNETIQTLSKIL